MPKVDALVPVQSLDTQIHREKSARAERPRQLAGAEEKVARATANLEGLRAEIKAIKLEAAKRELSMKEFEDKINKLMTQMNMARKNDEFQAFQKEISGFKAEKMRVEEGLLDLMYQVEEKGKLEKVRDGEVKAAEAEHAAAKKKIDAEIVEFDGRIAELQTKRTGAVAGVDKDILGLYERILAAKDDGLALAPVERSIVYEDEGAITYWNCGGCSKEVTKQDANEIKRGKEVVKCRGCSRLLYWTTDSEAPKEAGKT